jgi:hypothetical protein
LFFTIFAFFVSKEDRDVPPGLIIERAQPQQALPLSSFQDWFYLVLSEQGNAKLMTAGA